MVEPPLPTPRLVQMTTLAQASALFKFVLTEESGVLCADEVSTWITYDASVVYLLWAEDAVVGACGILYDRYQPNLLPLLDVMAVADAYRGRHLGRNLLEAALSKFRQQQPTQPVMLYVYPDNAIAIALYESVGFSCTGIMQHRTPMDQPVCCYTLAAAISK